MLGRPENDGTPFVWYTLLEQDPSADRPVIEFIPVEYDYRRLAAEMASENLPDEFIQTVHSGWWTTCLEVLPGKERAAGKF